MSKATKKSKKQKWFIRTRGSYLANSWQGVFLYVPYITYLVGVLVIVLHSKMGFWMGVLTVVPNWIAAMAVMQWIASRRS